MKTFSVWDKKGFLGYIDAIDLDEANEAAAHVFNPQYAAGGVLYVYPDCGEPEEGRGHPDSIWCSPLP